MRIAIIGGGISGLTAAHLFKDIHEVHVYEKCDRPGGLIKCDVIEGSIFHRTGGHVFNTKRQDVKDLFWKFFDEEKDFLKANRRSVVSMGNGDIIPYPIEDHFYLFEDNVVKSIVNDLLDIASRNERKDSNFVDFLQNQFGPTLYELYFKPYNKKVWRRDLKNVSLSWLEGKLPMPSIEEILYNNLKKIDEKKFVHSTFYYPIKDGSQFLADKLAQGLDINYNSDIQFIKKYKDRWIIDGSEFEMIIFCGNIKQLPQLIKNQIDLSGFDSEIDKLEFHGTTSVFCEIDKNNYTWVYLPDQSHESHRIICTGNFSPNNNAHSRSTATIEFTDFINREEIVRQLEKVPFHPRYLAHNYEKFTYPIQNAETRNLIASLKKRLEKHNIFLLGRFAEWEYYNMDVAMGAAIDLNLKLKR